MTYPTYDKRKKAIEEVLKQLGGESKTKVVIEKVTQKFPQLTQSALTRRVSSGVLTWPNKLSWDRVRMIKEDILDNQATRGIWRLKSASVSIQTPLQSPLDNHQKIIDLIKSIGNILGKDAQGFFGIDYKHDVIWRDNSYKSPSHVWEVCDKGNLDKDIAS